MVHVVLFAVDWHEMISTCYEYACCWVDAVQFASSLTVSVLKPDDSPIDLLFVGAPSKKICVCCQFI